MRCGSRRRFYKQLEHVPSYRSNTPGTAGCRYNLNWEEGFRHLKTIIIKAEWKERKTGVVVGPLHMSAAFDVVNKSTLISQLRRIGIQDTSMAGVIHVE